MKKALLLFCAVLTFSCSSDDDSNGGTDTSNFAFYINASIGGIALNTGIPTDVSVYTDYGASNSYQPQYHNNGGCVNINYEPSLYPTFNDNSPYMGVGFIGFIENAGLTCSDELDNFDTLFPVGTYSYASGAYAYGAKVNYATTGNASQVYYNSYGAQDANASFSITSVEPFDCGFSKCVIISGTFSCRVYNEQDATDFIDITNGAFKLSITSFNP